jgi:hypothetical protein
VNTSFRTIGSKWQQNAADRSWGLFIAGSGADAYLDAYVTAAGGFPHISGGTIPVGTDAPFTNVAMTYSAVDGVRIYVDGAEVGSTAAAGNMRVSTPPVRIGDTPDTGVAFDGLIDHVEYFDRALTAAEVASIYIAAGAATCGPTPTPTATPTPTPTRVDGSGTINVPGGGQATFNVQLGIVKTKKGKSKTTGTFSYSDPPAPLTLSVKKITGATITGNNASFSGKAKTSGQHGKISFTINVIDNGIPGTSDTFSILIH